MNEIDTSTKNEIEKRTRLVLSDAGFKAPPVDVDVLIESLAEIYDAVLLTGDPAFKALEQREQLGIHWLNR